MPDAPRTVLKLSGKFHNPDIPREQHQVTLDHRVTKVDTNTGYASWYCDVRANDGRRLVGYIISNGETHKLDTFESEDP